MQRTISSNAAGRDNRCDVAGLTRGEIRSWNIRRVDCKREGSIRLEPRGGPEQEGVQAKIRAILEADAVCPFQRSAACTFSPRSESGENRPSDQLFHTCGPL